MFSNATVLPFFLFDLEKIQAADVRHAAKEGRILKNFRAACRRFFGAHDEFLESQLRRLADVWLAYTSNRNEQGLVADEVLDAVVEEGMEVHKAMSKRLMALHADAVAMPSTAKKVWLSAGDVLDQRLPVHLRSAAAAAEKAENHVVEKNAGQSEKRGREDTEKAGHRRQVGKRRTERPERKEVAAGNFWCVSCMKELPKTDKDHRLSAEHLANAKKRHV